MPTQSIGGRRPLVYVYRAYEPRGPGLSRSATSYSASWAWSHSALSGWSGTHAIRISRSQIWSARYRR